MRAILIAFACLLIPQIGLSQAVPDTFSAGVGDYVLPFQVNDNYDSCRVAMLLPESIGGRTVNVIRARFDAPVDGGPVAESTWLANAAFTWGIVSGTSEEPGISPIFLTPVDLKSDPNLRVGGWLDSQAEWDIPEGTHYWLIGYWQQKAKFVRLSQSQYPQGLISISVADQSWQSWSGGGLLVEVLHSATAQEIPAGVFDSPPDGGEGTANPLRASLFGSELVVSLTDAFQPYRLTVVNVLGQTIVDEAGESMMGEIRLPWSASRPSGVYFCRVVQGNSVYTIPVVNLK